MTERRPEYTRPFSVEYHAVTGREVHRMFDGPFKEFVDAAYVAWLEEKLKEARGGK